MAKKTKIALIDANALIHRAYHALPPMSARDGTPTNAVYGFTAMLLKMFTALKPTYAAAAFDMKGPTFRQEMFADYKAHRKETPDDLIEQFSIVKEILRAFDMPIVEKKGYEADDIIGTLVAKINGSVEKIIVTGDMDALQLIDKDTKVFRLKKGITDTVLYDAEAVREEFGFDPEHIVDYKGLRGDPSDNIPGVAGVGEKTAKELVATYGSIESIFSHLEELPGRAKKRLAGKQAEALFSRELATIKKDVDISFSLDDANIDGYDAAKVRRLFTELDFRSLAQRLPGGKAPQPSLFASQANHAAAADALPDTYHLVTGEAEEKALRQELAAAPLVAFDTETDALGARLHPVVGMSFAVRKGKDIHAWYVPTTPEKIKQWKGFFENSSIQKTGHNLKYDYEVLLQSGIELKGIAFDSMIAAYLLNPGGRQYSLDVLASEELEHDTIPLTSLIGTGKGQKRVSEAPLIDIARYAAEDADISLRLYEKLMPRVEENNALHVLSDIELPLIGVLAKVELNGILLDTKTLSLMNTKITRKIQELEEDIWEEAGEKFNINSTQQLRVILFERLNMPTDGIKRTQTGYSTAAAELEKLRDKHAIIAHIESYRELVKLKNTYVDTLPLLADKNTGRVHTSFNQVVAATGRLSSSDPNLQNIPVRTELGQEIRRAFIAEKGNALIKADYSQIELRLAAHLSQDGKMLDVFRAGQDIHAATAAWVCGVDIQDVTPEQRREAKTLNFGVLYGMGPYSFAQAADISIEEARSFIGKYKEQYEGLSRFIDTTIETARGLGYTETLFGRRRFIPEIHSRTPMIRAQAERMAYNFPLQGTAADILKKAMIALQGVIDNEFPRVRMLLTVHDELVCEAPKKEASLFAKRMREVMESVAVLDIPLVVDVGIGSNWQDTENAAG